MEIIIAAISSIIAVLGLIGAIFNFSVIKPLNAAIANLQVVIQDLHSYVNHVEEKRQEMAEELAELRESTKNAHKRITEHGEMISDLMQAVRKVHDK